MDVTVLAFNNCLTSSVIGILDVFEICNNFWKSQKQTELNYFNVKLATVDGEPVNSFISIPIYPSDSAATIKSSDLIIIPPVMSEINHAISENVSLFPWLIDLHSRGSIVASICTGIFFLGESGLLDGKKATTNPLVASFLEERYPKVELDLNQILIDEGDIITSGPTYAFLDLMIYLVEKYCGLEVALQCSKLLLHDKNRSMQTPYLMSTIQKLHQDVEIKSIQDWLEKNYTKSLSVSAIADDFCMSPKNLNRRFQKATGDTPLVYLQKIRVENAKKKLETTQLNIDEITYDVGYTDSKSFGRLFKRHTTLSPTEYRKRFSSR